MNMKLITFIALFFTVSLIGYAQVAEYPPVITGGTLLFKEDFGGNNTSDPTIGTASDLKGDTPLQFTTTPSGGK